MVSLPRSPSTVPSKQTVPPAGAGAGAEVDDVVGDRDRLGLVLDDEHGVALVPQLQQQVVHPLDVVRVQADRGLVEDVGDVGERRAEVADHLGALRLAARTACPTAGRARGSPARSPRTSRGGAAARRAAGPPTARRGSRTQSARSLICIAQTSAMFLPLIFDDRASLAEPGAVALGTGRERHRPLHEGADVRLHRVDVLGEHRLLDLRDQALVGEVDALDLDLGRLLVEQVVQLLLGVLARSACPCRRAGAAEDAAVPAVHAVAGDRERALVERLAVVVQRRQVEVGDRAHALAARTHAAETVERRLLGLRLARPRSTVIAPLAFTEGTLNEYALGEPMCGFPSRLKRMRSIALASVAVPTVERGLAPIRSWSTMIAVVSPSSTSTSGPRQRRHEALHEGAVGLVDHPLRLRGDRAEHQRALARAGDAGEHRQPALRDLDADVLEVVHARALHADQIVAVGSVQRRRLRVRPRGLAHRVSICRAGPPSRSPSASPGSI